MMKKTLIFGTGEIGRLIYDKVKRKRRVIGFLDNNPDNWGGELEGIPVLGNVSVCENIEYDEILIGSYSGRDAIREQLLIAGVAPEKVNCDFVKREPIKIKMKRLYQLYRKSYKIVVGDPTIRENMRQFYKSAAVLRGYKNRYEGKRCFVIGNGPSLRAEDLDKIKGEFSIACNRIFFIYGDTEWRPTIYTTGDPIIMPHYASEISRSSADLKLIALHDTQKMPPIDGVEVLRSIPCESLSAERIMRFPFSEDISSFVYGLATITYINLQIAVYLGFKEIILLGVDHSFRNQIIDGKLRTDEGKQNHFHAPDVLETAEVTDMDKATFAYIATRKYAQEHGIRVLNATRGGKLEVFERVNFDDLI